MDKKGTILLIKGLSAYNVLRLATDEMAVGFTNNGYDVEMLDLLEFQNNSSDVFIKAITNRKYSFIFAMQSVCTNIKLFGVPITDYITTPFFGYIVDHPVHHDPRLIATRDNYHLLLMDKRHKAYVETYCKNIINSHMLYHGGFSYEKEIAPLKDREIDVFVSGSYTPLTKLYDQLNQLDNENFNFIVDIINELMEAEYPDTPSAVENALLKDGIPYPTEAMKNVIGAASVQVDIHIRNIYRIQVIEALLDSGIKVTVCGSGFDKYEGKNKENITVLSETGIDITETIEVMANSKIVLNVTPTHSGSHERIYTTMNIGAVSVTNTIPDMLDEFKDNEDYVLFSLKEIHTFPEKVKYLLDNLDYAQKIADSGRIKSKNHTWESRAKDVINIYDQYKEEGTKNE